MQQQARNKLLCIGVCADDFGMSPGINRAVLELAAQNRISALSCLVDGPAARDGAAMLRAELPAVDVGLHLNLTDPFPGATLHFPLPLLIARCYARCMSARAIRDGIRCQLDRFEHLFGCAPHHVDGHQHVHQLPLVRTELLGELARRYPDRRPWVRSCRPPRKLPAAKPAIIGALGAGAFTRQAKRLGFDANRYLLGVYDFQGSATEYLRRLGNWFAHAGDGDLLMCHPAAGLGEGEPHGMARRGEYSVLAGPQYPRLLAAANLVVARLSRYCPGD